MLDSKDIYAVTLAVKAGFSAVKFSDFKESNVTRNDKGEFSPGGDAGSGSGGDSGGKDVSKMSPGELKTHKLKQKLAGLKTKNESMRKDVDSAHARIADMKKSLADISESHGSNRDLVKKINTVKEKINALENHTKQIDKGLREQDLEADKS